MLDSRKEKVLAAVVEDYINTAEPVGSRTLTRKYHMGVSPATIRNEMADLEELGYLEQPHTSACRIPSERGYRYYVDTLMKRVSLSTVEEAIILGRLQRKVQQIEDMVRKTCDVLSEMTSYTAVVLGPRACTAGFEQIQLLPISGGQVLLVSVSTSRLVQHRVIDVPQELTSLDLFRVSQVLTSKLQGKVIDNIKKETLAEIYSELASYRRFISPLLELLADVDKNGEEKVYLAGVMNLLSQPEFRDVERIRSILGTLEDSAFLRGMLQGCTSSGLAIRIGGENKHQPFNECSLVTSVYQMGGQAMGIIGILGPTRMEYSRTVATVETLTRVLSQALADYYW